MLRLHGVLARGPLVVGLLEDEPAGVIQTRNAGVAEFEASLEWPPGWDTRVAVLPLLPAVDDSKVRASLRESTDSEVTMVRGTLAGLDEEDLSAALDELLRTVVSVAGVREAALRTRVARPARAYAPEPGAVQGLALRLWRGGVRVRFGPSWSPTPEGAKDGEDRENAEDTGRADVTLGCRGARKEMLRALGVDHGHQSG
ncbi:hypothetical protein [Rubrobacter aplysinae]|uniref:hypothetical protein n=1 Tax=Rubrobacter aplysinae TaxID=909625 RepID=UPI00128D90E6|nr:hypothetical protein [Rubrobacter aplysinae]